MELNLILLFAFCVVAWFIAMDESVAEFVVLVGEYIKTKTRIGGLHNHDVFIVEQER